MFFLCLFIRLFALAAEWREQRFLSDQYHTDNRKHDQDHIRPDLSDERTEQADDTSPCQPSGIVVPAGLSVIGK